MLGSGWWLVAVLPNSKYAGNPADRGLTSGDNKLPLRPDVDPIASPSHRNNFAIKKPDQIPLYIVSRFYQI